MGLTCLIAALPISGALAKDGVSSPGLCISVGGADISIPPGKCKDQSGKDQASEPNHANGAQGAAGDNGKQAEKKAGKRSGAHDPSDSDARPLPLPASARPIFGRAVAAAAVSGEVLVRRPGARRFIVLTAASRLPNGSIVDASAGVVQLTSVRKPGGSTQTAAFSGTTFTVAQASVSSGVTELKMRGRPSGCRPSTRRAFAVAARSTGRRLWGNGHGRFRTRGRYGAATVRGTAWLTEDRCEGTLVRVRRGRVAVRDLVRGGTTLVGAGHSRLVRAPR